MDCHSRLKLLLLLRNDDVSLCEGQSDEAIHSGNKVWIATDTNVRCLRNDDVSLCEERSDEAIHCGNKVWIAYGYKCQVPSQ